MSNRKFQNVIFKDCGPRLSIDKVVEFETKIGSMTLSELRVFFFSKDYPVQIGYVLPCEWDEEHGFAVLMKENKVIDAGPEDALFYH